MNLITEFKTKYNIDFNELRPVFNFDGYFISASGEIFSTRNKRLVALKIQDKEGRLSVTLTKDGKRYKEYVSRISWESFNKQDIPLGKEIDHIDNNPKNNNINNLQLISKSENISKSSKGRSPAHSVVVLLKDDKSKKILREFKSIQDCNQFFKENSIPIQANLILNGYDKPEKLIHYGYILERKTIGNIIRFKKAKHNPIIAIRNSFDIKNSIEIKEHPFIKSVTSRYFADSVGMIYKVKANTVEKKNIKKNESGYIALLLNGIHYQAHRFVYECFHNIQLNNKVCIDHIDGNRTNNAVNNLRLSNPKHNAQSAHNKKIFIYYFKGNLINSFSSVNEAAKFIETNQSNLSSHLSGRNFLIRKRYFVTIKEIENPTEYFTERYLMRYKRNGYKTLWKWAKYCSKYGNLEKEFENMNEIIENFGDIDSGLEEHIKGKFSTCSGSLWLALPPTIDFPDYHPESDKYGISFKYHEYIKRIYQIQNQKYNKQIPLVIDSQHLADTR